MGNDRAEVIERERQIHNERFSHDVDPRSHLGKWYASIRDGADVQGNIIRDLAKDKDVLEYGCSTGWLSMDALRLPAQCKFLTGIDISDVAIEKAIALADKFGY